MGTQPESDRYRLLSQHFQACAELAPEERERYILGPGVADTRMRQELRSLLQFHAPSLEAATPPPSPGTVLHHDTKFRKLRRNRTLLFILGAGAAATALTLAATSLALGRMESDLRRDGMTALSQNVDARAAALRAWADRQRVLARHLLEDPALVAHVAVLAEVAEDGNGSKEALVASPSYAAVRKLMSRAPGEIGERGFVIVTPGGTGLCAEPDTMVGRQVAPSGGTYLRRGILGEWIVSRPYAERQFAVGLDPDYSRPVMFVGGPITDAQGKVIAMGAFRFNPQKEFFPLLPQGAVRTLAFDDKGFLLNDYGETDELRKAGLIPADPEEGSSPLRLRLREPGGNLNAGYRPDLTPESWPPTLMSRHAVEGGRGSSATEYRDVLGRPVLGAWTWLPEWEMGVGAEQEVDRVLAPLKPVRLVSALFVGLPLAFTAALFLTSRSFRSLIRHGKDSTFGSYVLERSIGKGGMAEVFLARHEVLKRPAAVKILSNPDPDASAVARFEREARLACRLGHPNTIQIFDYGETPEGKLYYAMEYVKGVNLAQLTVMEGTLPVARIVYILRQIAGALEEAQLLGLLHRDLKPSNIMICSKGGLGDVVKVLDFGIACSASPSAQDFTGSVELVGTPAYIAPERIQTPQSKDPRSDIYSFGAVAFHLLTGRHVFEGPGPTELIYQVMTARRPSPSQLRGDVLPAALEELVRGCLAIDPDSRPHSFREVLEVLDRVAPRERWDQEEARAWWDANRERLSAFIAAGH
jgi:hypothetical protein